MLAATPLFSLATAPSDPGGSGMTVITPSPAELVWPTIAFLLIALLAGTVVFVAVRGVFRSRDDLEHRLDRVEAENAELRDQLERMRRSSSV